MKLNDKKELHTRTLAELKKLVKDAMRTLENLKFDKEQVKLKNTRSIFLKRKEIAVLKTIITKKEADTRSVQNS